MFDLFRSRDKAVRYLLGALLGVVALSMVITLIPGFGSSSGNSPDDQVVAEIGKTPLTAREVQTEMQGLVRNKQIPAELMQAYMPQRLDQMITERAVAYEADRMGYEVPDAELAATIRGIFPKFFQNGQLVDKTSYEQALAQQGYTINDFETNLRKQMQLKRLWDLALEGTIITPQEAKQEFQRRNDKLKIAYVAFKPDNLKSQVKVTTEELQGYFNGNKAGFTEPEKRDLVILVADQDKIAAGIDITDAQLQQVYSARKESFRTPERVKVRHILFMTTGKSQEEVAKIKAKAEDTRKQLTNANFGDIAKKLSEDPGSKDKGGELGYVTRGQMVKNFEAACFSQKPGDISGLVTTEYGFHIIQVEEKQDAHLQTFDEVKTQLAGDAKRAQVTERMQAAIEDARAAMVKAPGNYDQIAQQYGLALEKATNLPAGTPIPGIPPGPEMETALSGLKAKEVSQVFQVSPTKLAIAEITNLTPARPSTFAEAESKVRENFSTMRAQALAADRGKQAADRIKAGEDPQKIAKEMAGDYKAPEPFTMEGTVEGIGAGNTFFEGFSKPAGTVLGPLNVIGQQVVAKVIAKVPADMAGFEAQRETITTQLKQKRAQQRKALFEDSILAKLIKEGKVKKHNDTIKRLMGGMRG